MFPKWKKFFPATPKGKDYKALRILAEDTCATKVQYPCDAAGVRLAVVAGCLWHDSAVGRPVGAMVGTLVKGGAAGC
jgi:hypothetical protein